jgi:hypothetical protein
MESAWTVFFLKKTRVAWHRAMEKQVKLILVREKFKVFWVTKIWKLKGKTSLIG